MNSIWHHACFCYRDFSQLACWALKDLTLMTNSTTWNRNLFIGVRFSQWCGWGWWRSSGFWCNADFYINFNVLEEHSVSIFMAVALVTIYEFTQLHNPEQHLFFTDDSITVNKHTHTIQSIHNTVCNNTIISRHPKWKTSLECQFNCFATSIQPFDSESPNDTFLTSNAHSCWTP